MGISEARDLEAVHDGLTRWVQWWRPDARDIRLAPLAQPGHGPVERDDLRGSRLDPSRTVARGTHRGCAQAPAQRRGPVPLYDLTMQGGSSTAGREPDCPRSHPSPSKRPTPGSAHRFSSCRVSRAGWCSAEKPYLRRGWLADATPEARPLARRGRRHPGPGPPPRLGVARLGDDPVGATDRPAPGRGRRRGLAGEVEHWARYLAWAGEGAHHRSSRTASSGVAPGSRRLNRRPRCYGETSSSGNVPRGRRHGAVAISTSRWRRRPGRSRSGLVRGPARHVGRTLRRRPPRVPRTRLTIDAYERRAWAGPLRLAVVRGLRRARSGAIRCAPPGAGPSRRRRSWLTHENPTIELLAG